MSLSADSKPTDEDVLNLVRGDDVIITFRGNELAVMINPGTGQPEQTFSKMLCRVEKTTDRYLVARTAAGDVMAFDWNAIHVGYPSKVKGLS